LSLPSFPSKVCSAAPLMSKRSVSPDKLRLPNLPSPPRRGLVETTLPVGLPFLVSNWSIRERICRLPGKNESSYLPSRLLSAARHGARAKSATPRQRNQVARHMNKLLSRKGETRETPRGKRRARPLHRAGRISRYSTGGSTLFTLALCYRRPRGWPIHSCLI